MYTLETTNAEKSKETKMLNIHLKSLRKKTEPNKLTRVNRHTMYKPTKPKVSSLKRFIKLINS